VADGGVEAEALLARLHARHFRALEQAHLRWTCLASVPVWLQTSWRGLPGALAWLAVLAQAFAFAMAVGYAFLAARWARRAAALAPAPAQVAIHTPRSEWDELRSALWTGLAAASLVPCSYVAFDRAWPPALLSALTVFVVAVLVLLVLVETAAELASFLRRDGPLPARGAPARRS
jgi:hypothetical protein